MLNAAAELPTGEPGRAAVAGHKAEVERLLREQLGTLHPDGGAVLDDAAQHLSFLLEGAMARSGLEGHDARLHTARRMASVLLDQLTEGLS